MDSLQERIVAYANASANLLAQLNELNELREKVSKAQLSAAMSEPRKQRYARVERRVLEPSANWR
jgi:hypothetical protein